MKIEICYSPSGFGLVNDAIILKETLNELGYTSHINRVPGKSSYNFIKRFFIGFLKAINSLYLYRSALRLMHLIDNEAIIIHLENLDYLKLFSRKSHVLIPNQEWYDPHKLDLLKHVRSVWCKTRLAESIFSELSCKTQFIGFRSKVDADLMQSESDTTYFLSRTGMSAHRGAEALINSWANNPQWPTLKLLIHPSRRPNYKPNNVEYLGVFESQEEYSQLSARSLFHIYLTETEGFGHSIVEALGYGAVVIALDAPPMSEILSSDCALLIKSRYIGQKRLSPRFGAQADSIEEMVNTALKLSREEIRCLSSKARSRYSILSHQFSDNLQNAILGVTNRT